MSVKPLYAAIVLALSFPVIAQDEHGHEENKESASHQQESGHQESEQEKGSGVELSQNQLTMANITTATLKKQIVDYPVYAPGEVVANDFNSYVVSPRIDSTVLKRFVSIGDHVEKIQPLATLFSARMAEAQSQYLVSLNEWQRVQSLGQTTVGEKRYVEARNDFSSAKATLQAFGMSGNDIKRLAASDYPIGQYQLTADISGIVVSDDFRQGQQVNAGNELVEVLQEETLWVNARLSGTADLNVNFGDLVTVEVDGQSFNAKVIQEGHTIDNKTRTRTVRLAVKNEKDQLHPGLFADVYFSVTSEHPVLAVKNSALLRAPDGDWQIFIEHEPGKFEPKKVEIVDEQGEWKVITGVDEGVRYVESGAFFVRSQIAKGGFDPHNH
ncbi:MULTISPECIES: efflux RND transporter periplasmic adaptor subunit [Idiomarina]|jgi:RND family efflux transporter MFP subunit|uniref:efflux RND transporter periplasmic adaptor subunit n=1 Tax=Idiomarina TaxID=135575 RepID=UPI000C489560|nr:MULTISPECIES: efflux RND transporter periplasmic adaptor subunit [Idiomarina]MAO68396.1 hemolysin D [Idiomarina sp.]MBF80760.1 hemolysin D [Idiomarina sp.]|tara:strand:+ start:6881 stop:8032 length:1152 start_codon:yes stop_codon:yes gene_type:complete